MPSFDLPSIISRLVEGSELGFEGARDLFRSIVTGEITEIQLASAVSCLKVRGESASEMAGAASALLDSATVFPRPDYPFADVVGTGGDGHNTINLSTIAAITAACCGVKIVKHGNRSISSCSGSFDLLESLGVEFQIAPEQARKLVDQNGICFLFAPLYHPGLKHAAGVRKALGVRTIFNLLGPLVNPARPPRILLGVARADLLQPIASVLSQLGCENGVVVHGSGVDEVAIHAATQVAHVQGVSIENYEISPADFGASQYPLDALTCHQAEESHARSKKVLAGSGSDAENAAVAVNTALVLRLFGRDDLKENFAQALDTLRSGKPLQLVSTIAECHAE